jgi:hypothetical protein
MASLYAFALRYANFDTRLILRQKLRNLTRVSSPKFVFRGAKSDRPSVILEAEVQPAAGLREEL